MPYKDPIKYKEYQKDYRIKNRAILLPKHRIACHNHYLKNKDRINVYKKQYRKDHPEIFLKGQIKYCLKLSKIFNFNHFEFKMALGSWSKSVRKRDDYTCQICGIRDEINNIAHHIIQKIYYPKLMFNINNGITLCFKCHRECHM